MMRFTIDGEKFEFDPRRLMNVEAIAIKRVTSEKWGWSEWSEALQAGDIEALTALVWIAKKRITPDLRFSDVEFNIIELLESLENDEETDAEPDPTDTTTNPVTTSELSPTTSESESGSSTA